MTSCNPGERTSFRKNAERVCLIAGSPDSRSDTTDTRPERPVPASPEVRSLTVEGHRIGRNTTLWITLWKLAQTRRVACV